MNDVMRGKAAFSKETLRQFTGCPPALTGRYKKFIPGATNFRIITGISADSVLSQKKGHRAIFLVDNNKAKF